MMFLKILRIGGLGSFCVFGVFCSLLVLLFFSPSLWGKNVSAEKARVLDFSLQSLSGDYVSIASFRGRPIVLNFWATWCPPCVAEMPALNRLAVTYRQRGLVVVGVNVGESSEKVNPFILKLGISFPILLDRDGTIEKMYHVVGVPTTFFIDKEGVIKDVAVGGASYPVFEEKVNAIL